VSEILNPSFPGLPRKAYRAASLEGLLRQLVRQRGAKKSCCPSEIARAWAQQLGQPEQWRDWMEAVREKAFLLQQSGQIEVTQKGLPVSPHQVRGPIRLRWLAQKEPDA